MRNFSRWGVIVGVLGSSLAAVSATMVGCSGDDTVVPPDSGPDTTPDVKVDSPPPVEAGPDVKDAGPDISVNDASAILQFIADHRTKVCARYAQCCFGSDAGAFDQSKCDSIVASLGWSRSIQEPQFPGIATGGRILLDPTAAATCIASVSTFSCPSIQASENNTMTQACYKALTGTQGAGQPCNATVECASGNYCSPGGDAGDAGTGVCTALSGSGGACNTASPQNNMCQYRGYLGTASRCDGTNKCNTRLANGIACNYDWECTSGLCDNVTFTCGNSALTTSPFLCSFITKDAGSD